MRDSVPSARYSPICNVLRQWKTSLISIYRVCDSMIRYYQLIYKRRKKHFLNEQRSKDAAAKKRPNTSGVGKINNYYEDICIPPYNSTD